MAKKKNTTLSYDQYQQKYGKSSDGTLSYDQMMQKRNAAQKQEQINSGVSRMNDYLTRLRSRAQTAATQKAYQDARWSPNGDQSHLVYAATMINQTPGALEKEKERQRNRATKETENMKRLTQDLTYGYGGRYDPSLAYQAAQMGVSADQVRGLVNQQEKNYRTLDKLNKEYEAWKNTTYAGVKADREKNNTGYNMTVEQFNRLEAQNRKNTAEGLNNNGSDLLRMNDEGLAAYKKNAAEEAEKRRAKIKEYENYDPDAAKAGLYERFYQKDLANEQAILDNPVYKGTENEVRAQAVKAGLESGYNAGWRQSVESMDRLLESGFSLKGKTPEEQQFIREEVYNSIMPDTYSSRIKHKGDKEELDAAIDEYIAGLTSPWGEGQQSDAIAALEREASAFDSQIKAAQEEEIRRSKMGAFNLQFEQMRDMGISQSYDPTIAPQVQTIISGDDEVYQVQGTEADKAYWWANNYGLLDQYGGVTIKTANKYMFLATDPDLLDKFNTFYKFDNVNGTKSAQAFLDGLDPYLSTMLTNYQDYYARSIAEKPGEGLVVRAATYGAAPVMGLIGTVGAITSLFGNESGGDNTSDWYAGSRFIQDVRSQQNEDVAEWADRVIGNGTGKVAQFMLGVIDSIGDNVNAMGIGTTIGGQGTETAMRLVQLIMSGEATSNKMIQSLEDGKDPTEAALYAVGDGIIEWITERYSLERIMGPDVRQLYGNKRAMASFLLRSAGAEGSEEIASDLLNMGLDSILSMIYGHEDEIKQRYNELVTSGMSDKDASRQAMEEKLRDIGLSGLAGAVSGLGMAGSRVVSTALETGRQGQNIQNKDGGMDTVLKLAQQMNEGTDSRTLADQLAAEIEKGNEVSNYDLGRLANLTALEVGEQRSQVIKDTITNNVVQQLKDKGVSEEQAQQFAAIISKNIFTGAKLTRAEISTLGQDERAIQLWKDFNTMSAASLNLAMAVKTETKPLDSIANKMGELVSENVKASSAAAAEIEKSISETETMEEAIDNLQARRSGLLSEQYANLAKEYLQNNPEAKENKAYLDDVMKIRLAAMTLDTMPETSLEAEQAKKLYTAAREEFNQIDEERIKNQRPAMEGQGVTTYNGAEYGTEAWKAATEGLSKTNKNVMGAVGEIAARFGYRVNMVNDPENPDVYGFEDADTGAITINVANGLKHHMLVTMAHEMTHWLEQNSRQGYDDLRSFVLQSLREQGENIQDRIVKIMDNYNMVMGEKAGAGMTINGAMLELVAQSSEGLLSSKRAAQELQNVNPDLFSKVKNFVQNIVARINAAIKGMDYEGSLSKEARALEKYREELADIWFNGRRSAMPGEPTEAQAQTEETPAAEGQKSYSVAQRDQAYMQAVESGNIEEQRRLVEQAAKDAKYTDEAYHGTEFFGFTKFDLPAGQNTVFVAYQKDLAATYTPYMNTKAISERAGVPVNFYTLNDKDLIDYCKKLLNNKWNEVIDLKKIEDGEGTKLLDVFAYTHRDTIFDTKKVSAVRRFELYDWLKSAQSPHDEYYGIYDLYTRPGNQLVIDADHRNWNDIPFNLNSTPYNVRDGKYYIDPTGEMIEKMEMLGLDYADMEMTVKTRDIAEWARKYGYDSVRINNVRDNGGRNYFRGDEYSEGDIGIFFNPEDVKSADPVTYDDNGDIIPPSERFNEQKKDIRFSLAQPVEERADGLVAVHNLREDELLSTIAEGGITAPSIAVVKESMGHSKYGDVSIVFYPDAINPRKSTKNRVYGADAYTPERYHARVEQEILSKEVSKASSDIQNLLKDEIKDLSQEASSWFNSKLYDDETDETLEEIVKTAYNNVGMLAAYQKSMGNDVEVKMRERVTSNASPENEQSYNDLINGMSPEMLSSFLEDYKGMYIEDMVDKYAPIFKEILSKRQERFSRIKLDGSDFTKRVFTNWFRQLYDYLYKGFEKESVFDRYGTKDALTEKTDEREFINWLTEKLKNVLGEKGIRNNQDRFTSIGKRKSFKQLHKEYTAKNVVKAMYENAQRKGVGADYFQGLMATTSKEYRSLTEIRNDSDRLKMIPEEEYQAYLDEKNKEMNAISKEIKGSEEYPDDVRRAFVEAGKSFAVSPTINTIKRAFTAEGYMLTDETALKVYNLMKEAQETATGYFEAKPERVIGFDEVAKVILPEKGNEQLKAALDNAGIEYVTYDGTDEDRLAKLNAVPNVQFSIAEGPDMDVDSFMLGLNEFNLPTYQEKTMLRQYKSHKGTIKLLEEKIRTWEKERDEIMARGRLDPATQAKVDELNKAVSDAKAATKKKQRTLIDQNNRLITEKWAIQKEGRQLTTEEKARLKEINQRISANNDEINGSSYDLSQLIRNTEEQKKALRGDAKMNFADSTRLSQINRRLEADRAKLNRMEKEWTRITGEKGYARMMKDQRTLMENLVSGRTAEDLEDTVNAMQEELDTVTKEMEERADNLKKLASAEAVLKIRQMFDNRGLKRIAAKLKADLGSELENSEIENRLALIALKMKQGKYDAENAEELADMLAGRMQREMTGYYIPALRGTTIVLGDVQMKELKGTGRTLKDIRAQLAGTGIRISDKGSVTLDSKWEDLCREFPTLDPKENVGNQLDALLSKIMDEKNQQETVFNNETLMKINTKLLEAAQELIPEIITDENSLRLIRESMAFVARVSGAAKSNAQAMEDINSMIARLQKKGESAVKTAKKLTGDIGETIDYFDQLSLQSEAAMWKEERLALIDQLKSENTKNLMEEAARWRERIEKDKSYREIAGENLLTRKRITTNVSRVKKLLINETDLKNIPEYMKGLAREMLSKIVDNDLGMRKLTGIQKKDLEEMSRVLGEMRKLDGDFMPDDLKMMGDQEAAAAVFEAMADLEEGLQEYNSQRTGDMMKKAEAVKATLDKISDAVSTITSVINAERNVNFWDHQAPVQYLADKIRADMANSRHKGEWKGTGSKAIEAVKRSVVYGNETPEYFIDNLRNRGMSDLWNDAKESENRNGLEVQKAQDRLAQLGEETNYKAWANEKHDVTLGGRKRTITIGNMMELYAIWKREKTSNPEMSQHLNKGGVFFQEEEKGGRLHREVTEQRAIRVTDEEILAMYDSMTENQKKLIEGVVSYLSNEMSQLGNEASMRMYGIRKYKELYYFPMKVWDGVKSARSDKGIMGTDENRMAHYSFSKRRMHMAQNALVIGDFMTDAVNHIVEMINYNTMAPAIENINKVLNYKFTEEAGTDEETKRNLRVLFMQAYGRDALNYLETLMKDMNGGVTQDQRKTLRDKALTMFKKNAVAGSISVALQQPLSYIRASMMISPKYLAPAPVTSNWKNSYKEMMQYSGVAVIKRMGRFDMNFGQSAKDYIMPETKQSLYNRTSDALTKAPELMDAMTWTWMWAATKAETAAKNPGMDTKSEAFLKLTANRFNDVMRKTQVYDSVLVKSSNMRSNNLGMKVITSFMAEPTLSLNVLANAIRNVGTEGGKKHLAKALSTFFLSAIFQAGVKGLMGSGRTPDKKKTWLENFLNKFQYNLINEGNMFSLIPGYSDLIEVLKTGELQDDAMGAIGKLSSIVDTLRKSAQGNGKGAWRDVEDTVGQFTQLFTNIPAKNLMRDARAIYNWIAGSEYADRPTSAAVLRYQTEANFFNADNMLGTINTWLGDAGFVSSNSRYYSRIYDAMKKGDKGTEKGIKEYLSLAKGVKDDTINTGIKNAAKKDTSMTDAEKDTWMIKNDLMGENNVSTITTQYKKGQISAAEAKKLWKELDPKLTENDLYWKLDRADYQKETGTDNVSGYSYRLHDAIAENKGESIRKAIKNMLDHGVKKESIKSAITEKWKEIYLNADSRTRTAIRDAIQKAYKAIGLKAEDANKVIDNWKKKNK